MYFLFKLGTVQLPSIMFAHKDITSVVLRQLYECNLTFRHIVHSMLLNILFDVKAKKMIIHGKLSLYIR